jgi:hypothetical protein
MAAGVIVMGIAGRFSIPKREGLGILGHFNRKDRFDRVHCVNITNGTLVFGSSDGCGRIERRVPMPIC